VPSKVRAPKVEIIAGREAISQLEAEWRDIAGRFGMPGVFEQYSLLLIAATAAEATGSEPLVALTRDADGRPRTMLPLRATRTYGMRTAQSLSAPLGQYSEVIGPPLSAQEFGAIGRLLRSRFGIDLILLRRVRDDGGLAGALDGQGLSQNASTSAPYIDLEAFGSFEAYEASFSSTTRRSRRRRRAQLVDAHGSADFSVITGSDALPLVDQAIAWKRAWLAGQGLNSPVFDDGPWLQALRNSAQLACAATSVLRAGGQPAAIELGYLVGGTYTSYLGAFNPEFARFGVGQEQLRNTIQWAFEAGASRFDLMAPSDDYKLQLTRAPDTAVDVEDYVVPLTPLGRGMAEVRRHARPAAKAFVMGIRPEVRAVSALIAKPAAIAVAALGVAALVAE
jgi:CelD/BcsL family acetyltransferase involved in cellulose biosynthesis